MNIVLDILWKSKLKSINEGPLPSESYEVFQM